MKFLLLMYQDEKAMRNLSREEGAKVHGAFMAYLDAMKKEGVFVANHGLKATADAKTVRRDAVLDGPFAETREQLAGYFLIEVPDMAAALAWAKRNPTVERGSVEVRPVWM